MAKPNVVHDPLMVTDLLDVVKYVCHGDDYQRAVTMLSGEDWDEKDLSQIFRWIHAGVVENFKETRRGR